MNDNTCLKDALSTTVIESKTVRLFDKFCLTFYRLKEDYTTNQLQNHWELTTYCPPGIFTLKFEYWITSVQCLQDGELYLFIVGISQYYFQSKVASCKNQARTFINIFKNDYKGKRKNAYSLFDKDATKRNVPARLANFEHVQQKKDPLIIYFDNA